MKRIIPALLSGLCICSVVSCSDSENNSSESEWMFSKKVAREVCDDGWVYTFDHLYMKDGFDNEGVIPFTFSGINLRYRYSDNISSEQNPGDHIPVVQILGNNGSPEIEHDMELVAEMLDYEHGSVTKEELLMINPDDIEFKELDKDRFFNLMYDALNGEEHKEGKYPDIPSYALLTEPEYVDSYKFQIGFIADMGCVDVMFIDVLYEQGEDYNDYIQLSDLVENGKATNEQIQAFEALKSVSDGIVTENDLNYGFDIYKDNDELGINFSRLYTFLNDIESNNYVKYIVRSD
jgi:lipoprotein